MATPVVGLGLTCPLCGDGSELSLDLNNVNAVACGSCGETYSPAQAVRKAEAMADAWRSFGAWVEIAPVAR